MSNERRLKAVIATVLVVVAIIHGFTTRRPGAEKLAADIEQLSKPPARPPLLPLKGAHTGGGVEAGPFGNLSPAGSFSPGAEKPSAPRLSPPTSR